MLRRPRLRRGPPVVYVNRNEHPTQPLFVADFNNDGIMDLAEEGGGMPIFLGNATGTFNFTDFATFAYEPNFDLNNAAFGDFNGDGNVDIAYEAYFGFNSPLGLAVALGEGNGKFRRGWYEDRDDVAPVNVVVGDFNGDGKLDLITGNALATYVYLGNGDGTFTLSQTYDFGADGIRLAGDFNGDGNLDLALVFPTIGSQSYDGIAIALGNGDGTFQDATLITTYTGGCNYGPDMLVNDFNGDGKLDIAYCDDTNLTILLGNGDGTFQQTASYLVNTSNSFSFSAGDFNSDGKTDLIVSDLDVESAEFSILLGKGDGTFRRQTAVKLMPKDAVGELGITAGDFNSDGLLDFMLEGNWEYLQVQP
jgi:hypothetical protein